jgi:hypothetical protein
MWCEPERCGLAEMMKVVGPLLPPPPANAPPPNPTLSARENLLGLLRASGLEPRSEGDVECVFEFANQEDLVRGMMSAGIVVGMARAIGEDRMAAAMVEGCAPFRKADGSYAMSNWFRWVVCE